MSILIILTILVFIILNQKSIESKKLELTANDKEYLVNLSKKTVEQYLKKGTNYSIGNAPTQFLFDNIVLISFYFDGEILGSWSAKEGNIADSVIDATIKGLRDEKLKNMPITNNRTKISIILTIVKNETELTNRDEVYLSKTINLGLDGVRIEKNEDSAIFVPAIPIHQEWGTTKLLQNLCENSNLQKNCWQDDKIKLFKYDSISFLGAQNYVADIYRAVPLIKQETVDKDRIYKSIMLASDWQLRVQKDDGNYEYFFNPVTEYYSKENNLIRQVITAWSMIQAFNLTGNKTYLLSAERNINYILTYMKREGSLGYLEFNNISNLGSVATTLIAILELPNYKKYDEEINMFSNFLLFMQREDGSFKSYYKSNYSDDNDFYPGEALLALVELYNKTGNVKYLKAVERAFPFYSDYFAKTKHFGFIRWQISAFYEAFKILNKEEYANFVFDMADWIVDKQYDEKNAIYPDFSGGFNQNESVPTFSSGVYIEGIADAYELAKSVGDTNRAKKYGKSLNLASRFILQLQFDYNNSYYIEDAEEVIGAVRESLTSNNLRIDYTSHNILALIKIYEVYDEIKITNFEKI
ncbi:AMMECR1 domain-containing protein [Candidatus Woesearchaeota archaeon]|nr:AMMECR1 domain-containing protein [Candidatus Woesearchaeota archaeon]